MKYCSLCGGEVAFRPVAGDNRLRHVCTQCGAIHYQNPKLVVGCLVYRGDATNREVLMCRRAIEPQMGLWNLPAGYLENGETAEQGALRETWEEANQRVELEGLFALYNLPHVNQVYLYFLGMPTGEPAHAGEETLEVGWFAEANLPWDQIAFTSTYFALRKFFAHAEAPTGLPVFIGTRGQNRAATPDPNATGAA